MQLIFQILAGGVYEETGQNENNKMQSKKILAGD